MASLIHRMTGQLIFITESEPEPEKVTMEKSLSFIEGEKTLNLKHQELHVLDEKHGFIINSVKGGPSSVAITDKALKNLKGNVATRNIPPGYVKTMSVNDIQLLNIGKMKEMRASAKEGVYSLKRHGNKSSPGSFAKAYDKAQAELKREARAAAGRIDTKKYNNKRDYSRAIDEAHSLVFNKWLSDNSLKHGYNYTFTKRSK